MTEPDPKPRIAIHYCTQCHWLLPSAWMAQELLSTFGTDLGEVALVPGTGGVFRVDYAGEPVWERKREEIAKWDLQYKAYQRLYLGNANDVEMDNAGRVLIAPELREACAMSGEAKVMLVGLGTHFEVWEAAAYEASLVAAVPSGVPTGFAF